MVPSKADPQKDRLEAKEPSRVELRCDYFTRQIRRGEGAEMASVLCIKASIPSMPRPAALGKNAGERVRSLEYLD